MTSSHRPITYCKREDLAMRECALPVTYQEESGAFPSFLHAWTNWAGIAWGVYSCATTVYFRRHLPHCRSLLNLTLRVKVIRATCNGCPIAKIVDHLLKYWLGMLFALAEWSLWHIPDIYCSDPMTINTQIFVHLIIQIWWHHSSLC